MTATTEQPVGLLTPYEDFREAAIAAIAYLRVHLKLPFWLLGGINEDDLIILHTEGEGFEIREGDVIDFPDSLLARMLTENGPRIVPDLSAIPIYAHAPSRVGFGIEAFVMIPILRQNGTVFGTLCGFDHKIHAESLAHHAPLLDIFSRLLGAVLDEELSASDQARRAQLAEVRGLVDTETGLQNRRAFEQFVEQEEDRCKRHAHRATVFIVGVDFPKNSTEAQQEKLLLAAGTALKIALRRHDFIARIATNTFAIVAVEGNSEEITRVRHLLGSAFMQVGLNARIGVAARHPSTGIKYAWQLAEAEMVKAK